MPTPGPLAVKILRYFDAPSFTDNGSMFGLWLRVVYEFWGFCVNGTDDLKHPGGFATGSTTNSHLTGVINMPNGWESGSNILLYSNSDGSTVNGMPYFTGSNFLLSHVGKWLTVWKSGSTSSDDSIYLITKLYGPPGTATSSVIGVDNNMGGTPFSGNLKPAFTGRSNVNYRVIDYAPINQTHTDSHYICLSMYGAPYVNQGQANSQVRIRLASLRTQFVSSDFTPRGVAIKLIPSGNYVGSSSSGDGITGGNAFVGRVGLVGVATNIGEFGPNSGNSFDWHNGGGGTQCMNIFAAGDFMTFYSKGGFASSGCGWHIEIPQRLYPFAFDPNPMTGCDLAYNFSEGFFASNYGYSRGFYTITGDLQPHEGWTAIHHQAGDFYNTTAASSLGGYTNGTYNNMFFNVYTNKFFFSDALIGTAAVVGQHFLAHNRLRRVKFTAPIIPNMQRLGDNGEWLHVQNGILWPWDNALMPSTIFHQGF